MTASAFVTGTQKLTTTRSPFMINLPVAAAHAVPCQECGPLMITEVPWLCAVSIQMAPSLAPSMASKITMILAIMNNVMWTSRTFRVQVQVPPIRESMVVVMAIHGDQTGDVKM